MSKNVAVFVDVANIFYAAKAAGADIDYVTLLKSAVAGRDFVRAYAYTGLDPENENQRQFHSFLARSGYKVVSKDIRKYGDGRIKANLDIELVVDLMRTARNLDIAVVVSGDGDFAPAIRAVQQQGVRVEVISFRGNTSSDLIDVADQFIDIAQVARVDKDSARSGRRVATEGDLSMTEVPEKETEGAPRRRRGRGRDAEREDRVPAAVDAAVSQASLTALPGERLSRVGAGVSGNGDAEPLVNEEADLGETEAGDEIGPDGTRRRRRRGGRGRGRGRRPEGESMPADQTVGAIEEDEDFETVLPPPPPHQAFGSVWDSQLGVPNSAPAAATSMLAGTEILEPDDEDEDLAEPEIPEYLLAERRQRPQGPRGGRMGGGRGRGAYQAALDRERYGRSAPSAPSGFGGNRPADRPRPDRGRGPRPGRPERNDRPQFDRPQFDRPAPPMRSDRPTYSGGGSDPWSEVPADLEEMLRAELARKTSPAPRTPASQPSDTFAAPTEGAITSTEVPASTAARRGRPRTAAEPAATAEATAESVAEVKPKVTRSRTTKASKATAAAAEPAAEAPAKTTRARKPRTTAAAGEPATSSAAESGEVTAKPVTRRRRTKATDESSEVAPE